MMRLKRDHSEMQSLNQSRLTELNRRAELQNASKGVTLSSPDLKVFPVISPKSTWNLAEESGQKNLLKRTALESLVVRR